MSKADALKDAGNKYFKSEDYFRAIKCYKEGLQLDPGNPTLNCNLAQAYLLVKEFAEAEVHAVVTLAHQSDSVKGFYRAAKAALGMAKKERALSYLRTGLIKCPKADELKTLYEEICQESEVADTTSSSAPNGVCSSEKAENGESKKESHGEKNVESGSQSAVSEGERSSRNEQTQLRSRSSSSRKRNRSKGSSNVANARSISVNRSTKLASENSQNPEVNNVPQKDEFLDTLIKMRNELTDEEKTPQLKEREALMEKQKKLQTRMKEGFEALEIGLSKQASEKYKCALDIMAECNIEVFGLSEVDRVVLKYSLSICLIETRNYNSIVQSIGCLNEIECNYASELPAVYFGLGRAFYRLNRFKVALHHLDKGVNLIENCSAIIPHPWPGSMKTIEETTKVGLLESISNLQCECKTYRDPDAVCRYEECLTVSSHICPAEIIFSSDPDFVGYVVIICQQNCKITFHVGCWKHYKENLSSVKKLTDKDVLGLACLTSDCINERNEISLIVRIEIYGEDGELKTSCSKEPTKTDNVNEHRKEKKKKNERIDKPVKVKRSRLIRKITHSATNSPKKVKRKSTISSDEFAISLQNLAALRIINFGFEEASIWNPQMDYFGRPDISALETFLNNPNCKDSETLRERKDFLFTYFYEYLNDEGPQKISALEKKWHEEVSLFPGINEFLSQHDGICDFLLQSCRFACIDDYLCLAGHLTDTYQRVQGEIGESIAFILSNSSPHIDNETEDDDDIEMSKYVDNLIDDSNRNSFESDFRMHERADSTVASTSGTCSSGRQWFKRDSESDSFIIQATSESCSDAEIDFGEEIHSDNEYDDNFQNGEKFLYYEDIEIEDNTDIHNLPVAVISGTRPNDAHHIRAAAPGSVDSGILSHELENIDIKNIQEEMPVVLELRNDLHTRNPLVLKDVSVQTDFKCDCERSNQQLNQEAEMWNNEKKELIRNFQKEIEEYRQKLHMYECKLVENESTMKRFQHEMQMKDSKVEAMKKKHHEEINNLSKKKDADAVILKKNIESMSELNKTTEKQAITIDRVEGQLRRSNEQILNLRKQFGEFKLDCYLKKCQERLDCMKVFITLFEESGSIPDIKVATDAWESVARELRETRDLLQVQYDILSQQLKNKVSSDCLLQLELADLPDEPYYPLKDMNNILRLAVEYVEKKNSSGNEKSNETNKYSKPHLNNAVPSPPSYFLDIPPYQPNGNIYGARPPSAYGPPNAFSQPFYSNNYSTFSGPVKISPTGHHLNTYPSNQSMNSMGAGAWPSEFQATVQKNSKSDTAHIGDKVGFNGNNFLEEIANISAEALLSGHSDARSVNKVTDVKGPTSLVDLKVKDLLGEKKGIGSSAAGLTPIEMTKFGVADVKGIGTQNHKPIMSEIKPTTKPQKQWNYVKLFDELQKYIKIIPEAELSECLSLVREKNGNKLTGLSIVNIIRKVEKVLEDRLSKKVGNMGMDKFGGTAWGEVKRGDISWQNDEDVENECVICHIGIENNRTCLQCKHIFHTECIRKWLNTNSTCPICRKFTKLDDEFPPLG